MAELGEYSTVYLGTMAGVYAESLVSASSFFTANHVAVLTCYSILPRGKETE